MKIQVDPPAFDALPLKRFALRSTLCFALMLAAVLQARSQDGPAQLLKDIETAEEPTFNEYQTLMHGGSRMYFVSKNELWKSGGSTGNTVRLKKFSWISNLTLVGPHLYFTADDGASGAELWKSDGSVAGTVRVKDIIPGIGGSSPSNLTAGYGYVFFVASDNAHGRELWRSDGTDAGTYMVKDILKVTGSSQPSNLTNVGGTIFFSANDGANGYELWKTDGTAAGTVMVKDIRTGSKVSSSPSEFVNVNGTLYFSATDNTTGAELWKSDGTSAGTVRVKDIRAGSSGSGVENTIDVNGTLFFTANDGIHGDELWKSNGTTAGTVLVKDMNPGAGGSNSSSPFSQPMGDFANINGLLYFIASKGYNEYVYRSDGTAAGTVIITDALGVGINDPQPEFNYLNGKVYFFNAIGDVQYLYSMPYNGTSPSPVARFLTPEDYYETYYQPMITFNGYVFTYGRLLNEDVYEELTGYALVRSNGTREGTIDIKDAFVTTWGSYPREMISFKNKYVFMQASGYLADNEFLWVTDGTSAGTREIARMDYDHGWAVAGDYFYYTQLGMTPETWGNWELWRTQGPPETSQLLLQDFTNDNESIPRDMTGIGNALYYFDVYGGVWKSDAASTTKLADFDEVFSITAVGNTGYILLYNAGKTELWKTTTTGITKVSGIGGSCYGAGVTIGINNIMYFATCTPSNPGLNIWRTDGTAAGTYQYLHINDIQSGFGDQVSLGVYNGQLYVGALDGDSNWSLFKVNGQNSFQLITHLNGAVEKMVQHNGRLVIFSFADSWLPYHEVWSTDGTPAGTMNIHTLYPENFQYWEMPINYAIIGNALFFGAEYSSYLMRTDGMCADYVPVNVQYITSMGRTGNSLVLAGHNQYYGNEPFIYKNIPVNGICAPVIVPAGRQEVAETGDPDVLTPYPNPFVHEFTMRVEGKDEENADVVIYSSTGAAIDRFEGIDVNKDYNNIGGLWPRGMYFVKVNKSGEITTHIVVKQ